MKKETIKAIVEVGEQELEEVVEMVSNDNEKEEKPKSTVQKVLSVVGTILKNRKLITAILALVGLGSVATVFGTASEVVCSATAICQE